MPAVTADVLCAFMSHQELHSYMVDKCTGDWILILAVPAHTLKGRRREPGPSLGT